MSFDSKLIDIGVKDHCGEVLFILNEMGVIYFEEVEAIVGDETTISRYLDNFEDMTTCSLF